nr:MAG: hypothetical protein J07AB56_12560 [Candidatus Nanosalinarum sp. J07AB56]
MLILVTGSQGHAPGGSETITAAAPESPGSTGFSETPEVQVELESKESGLTEESVSFVDTNSGVTFNGSMRAPTPCYTIDHRVERPNTNRTIVDIQLERENGTQLCTQQIVSMSYKGSIADTTRTVEVRHDGETVGSFEARGNDSGEHSQGTGLIRRVLSILSDIVT